jgi:hypothetical protein
MAASKSPHLRLLHIRDEIDGMASALGHVTFAQYRESYTLRRAAERACKSCQKPQSRSRRQCWHVFGTS